MNLKIEPPPYEQILRNHTNKTLGQLMYIIDREECFANKTVETYIFPSLMSYFLNIYLKYVNKTVDHKDLPWMSGWNSNCITK